MHPAIIIGTVRSLWTWTWLCGRYHVPQNAFLVQYVIVFANCCTLGDLSWAFAFLVSRHSVLFTDCCYSVCDFAQLAKWL